MTVDELLEALDGCGIVYEDDELVSRTLHEWGWEDGLNTELELVEQEL